VRQEASQLHLAGMPGPPRLVGRGLTLCRRTPVGRRYAIAMSVIVARVRIQRQPADIPSKLCARRGRSMRFPVHLLATIEDTPAWCPDLKRSRFT
jgi:hypothetical protein